MSIRSSCSEALDNLSVSVLGSILLHKAGKPEVMLGASCISAPSSFRAGRRGGGRSGVCVCMCVHLQINEGCRIGNV